MRGKAYDWVEYFAGTANATRAARLRGAAGARFDIAYFERDNAEHCKTNYMDITSPSGFWLLREDYEVI